jgi:hypothetical protein
VAGENKAELVIDVCPCRDRTQMVESVLAPKSLVIIGRCRFHFGTPEDLTSVLTLNGSPYRKIRPATADTSLERKIKSMRETVDCFSSRGKPSQVTTEFGPPAVIESRHV